MRRTFTVLIAVMAISLLAISAGAGGFRFKSVDIRGGSLIFSGVAVGLGNAIYDINLEGTATVTAKCENRGGTQADGRNDLSAIVSTSTSITTDSNGKYETGDIVLENPTLADFGDESPSKKEAGCPNGNWAVVDVTLSEWTAAHLWVVDEFNDVVFDQYFDCSGDGATLVCTPAS